MIPFKHKPAAGSHENKTKPNILSLVLESQCALEEDAGSVKRHLLTRPGQKKKTKTKKLQF